MGAGTGWPVSNAFITGDVVRDTAPTKEYCDRRFTGSLRLKTRGVTRHGEGDTHFRPSDSKWSGMPLPESYALSDATRRVLLGATPAGVLLSNRALTKLDEPRNEDAHRFPGFHRHHP
jgi:hypothetical protein